MSFVLRRSCCVAFCLSNRSAASASCPQVFFSLLHTIFGSHLIISFDRRSFSANKGEIYH